MVEHPKNEMRQILRSATAILILSACAPGGGDATEDTTAAGDSPVVSAQRVPPSIPSEATTFSGAPSPVTGDIIEVRMVGDAAGYRFEPQRVTAKRGDGVRFVVVSGGPHEIAFDLTTIPEDARGQLQANMPNAIDGRSPLLSGVRETWTVSLGNLPSGTYAFVSTPRLPQGMKGSIEIQ